MNGTKIGHNLLVGDPKTVTKLSLSTCHVPATPRMLGIIIIIIIIPVLQMRRLRLETQVVSGRGGIRAEVVPVWSPCHHALKPGKLALESWFQHYLAR